MNPGVQRDNGARPRWARGSLAGQLGIQLLEGLHEGQGYRARIVRCSMRLSAACSGLSARTRWTCPGRREERRHAGPTSPHLLGEAALWRELDLELTGEELTLELLVPAQVGGDHPSDLLVLQQNPNPQSPQTPNPPTASAPRARHTWWCAGGPDDRCPRRWTSEAPA